MRMRDARGAIFQNPNAVIIPDTWDEGTINKDAPVPVHAQERIVIDGRQLYARGQQIKPEDIERYGLHSGRLTAVTTPRKDEDVPVSEGRRTSEQDPQPGRSATEREVPARRRGRPPGSRNKPKA